MKSVAIIGGGPAGLAAAEVIATAGMAVTVYDAKPSLARKFLMAGKSGLNLTFDAPVQNLIESYAEAGAWLSSSIAAFDSTNIIDWAEGLGQEIFRGSTGRVFPKVMKASPLLRAWLVRLDDLGVTQHTRWRWCGWNKGALSFDTPDGHRAVTVDAVVLALGGASWARLGSDGAWAEILTAKGIKPTAFDAANAAVAVTWSNFMTKHLGKPIKGVAWCAGNYRSRGEAMLSQKGLEGGGIYSVSRGVREGADLTVDLLPDLTVEAITKRLAKPRGKNSLINHLRKVVKLDKVKLALLNEYARPLPVDPHRLARTLKAVKVSHSGLNLMDEAISTSGGIMASSVNEDFMLYEMPGTFCAGEMLDWEAPTGGYLLTACLATGRQAGRGVVKYLDT